MARNHIVFLAAVIGLAGCESPDVVQKKKKPDKLTMMT